MATEDNDNVTEESNVITETPEDSVDIDAPGVVLGDSETEVNDDGDVTVDAGDTVVTVVEAESAPSEAVLSQTIENAVDVATLESRVAVLESKVFALEVAESVEAAEESEALEESQEDAEILDAIDQEPEDDDESGGLFESVPEPKSAKAHPLFRPFSEWRNK